MQNLAANEQNETTSTEVVKQTLARVVEPARRL